jgi:5-(carboxyamino)imidazole ribonucleotide synthase
MQAIYNKHIGIIGSGIIARFLGISAIKLGLQSSILKSEITYNELEKFDNLTLSNLNTSRNDIDQLGMHKPLWPDAHSLMRLYDPLEQAIFLNSINIDIPDWVLVEKPKDLKKALKALGESECILYNGSTPYGYTPHQTEDASCLALRKHNIQAHLSIAMARDRISQSVHYNMVQCQYHPDGSLSHVELPHNLQPLIAIDCKKIINQIVQSIDYIGTITVDLILTDDHQLLVTQIHPYPTLAFLWTLDACLYSVFDQHIRAISGHSIVAAGRHSDFEQQILRTSEKDDLAHFFAQSGQVVHLYGDYTQNPIGHVTVIKPIWDQAVIRD